MTEDFHQSLSNLNNQIHSKQNYLNLLNQSLQEKLNPITLLFHHIQFEPITYKQGETPHKDDFIHKATYTHYIDSPVQPPQLPISPSYILDTSLHNRISQGKITIHMSKTHNRIVLEGPPSPQGLSISYDIVYSLNPITLMYSSNSSSRNILLPDNFFQKAEEFTKLLIIDQKQKQLDSLTKKEEELLSVLSPNDVIKAKLEYL